VEIDPAPPRPRTSTRDSAALRERLAAWLERRLPGARLTSHVYAGSDDSVEQWRAALNPAVMERLNQALTTRWPE